MRCLHCGKRLAILRKFTDGEFCSAAHRRQYQLEQDQLALARLQESHRRQMVVPERPGRVPGRTVEQAAVALSAVEFLRQEPALKVSRDYIHIRPQALLNGPAVSLAGLEWDPRLGGGGFQTLCATELKVSAQAPREAHVQQSPPQLVAPLDDPLPASAVVLPAPPGNALADLAGGARASCRHPAIRPAGGDAGRPAVEAARLVEWRAATGPGALRIMQPAFRTADTLVSILTRAAATKQEAPPSPLARSIPEAAPARVPAAEPGVAPPVSTPSNPIRSPRPALAPLVERTSPDLILPQGPFRALGCPPAAAAAVRCALPLEAAPPADAPSLPRIEVALAPQIRPGGPHVLPVRPAGLAVVPAGASGFTRWESDIELPARGATIPPPKLPEGARALFRVKFGTADRRLALVEPQPLAGALSAGVRLPPAPPLAVAGLPFGDAGMVWAWPVALDCRPEPCSAQFLPIEYETSAAAATPPAMDPPAGGLAFGNPLPMEAAGTGEKREVPARPLCLGLHSLWPAATPRLPGVRLSTVGPRVPSGAGAFRGIVSKGLPSPALWPLLHFWKKAPADLKWVALAIPLLLLALVLSGPGGAPGKAQAALNEKGGMEEVLKARWATIRQNIGSRAAVNLQDDFRAGLGDWEGRGDWARDWTYDPAGFIRPGSLALYRPSLEMTDYHLEFLAQIEQRGIGWVVRAGDMENYQAIRLVVVKPGPLPAVALERYPVIRGKTGRPVQVRLPVTLRTDTLLRVRTEVRDADFTVSVQGQVADTWTEERLSQGGIGFFSARGERSRLRWIEVSHQYDVLGRLCAYLAPYGLQTRAGR